MACEVHEESEHSEEHNDVHVKFMESLSIQRNTMMACEVHGESEHSEEHNDGM